MMPALPVRVPAPHLTTGIAYTHVAPPVPRLRLTGTVMTHVVTCTVTEAMLTGTPQVPVGRRLFMESNSAAPIDTLQVPTGRLQPTNRKRPSSNNSVDVAEGGHSRRAHVVVAVAAQGCSRPRRACVATRPRNTICTFGVPMHTYRYRQTSWMPSCDPSVRGRCIGVRTSRLGARKRRLRYAKFC